MSILILIILEECFQIFSIEYVASCRFATYDTYYVEVCFIHGNKNMLCAVLSCSAVSVFLQPHGLQPSRLFCPWEFSRQEYWSGLPCPPPGDLPNPGIEPRSSAWQADSLLTMLPGSPYLKCKWTKCSNHRLAEWTQK